MKVAQSARLLQPALQLVAYRPHPGLRLRHLFPGRMDALLHEPVHDEPIEKQVRESQKIIDFHGNIGRVAHVPQLRGKLAQRVARLR